MTTPFLEAPQAYPGAQPRGRQAAESAYSKRLWIGRPELGLVELPSPEPSKGMSAAQSQGESAHTMINLGTGTRRQASKARTWTYGFLRLTRSQWDLLDAIQTRDPGMVGKGPWAFLNPEGRNRLTRSQSMCRDASKWGVTGGTVAADATPGRISPSGSLLFTPSAAGDRMVAATVTGGVAVPDVSRSAVYVPAEPFTAFAWCRAQSGTAQVAARVDSTAADGTVDTTVTGATFTVGTTPQLVAVPSAPGSFGSGLYLLPSLVSVDGNPLLMSNPMTSYTAEVVDWGPGGGVPRVTLTTGLPRDLSLYLDADTTLTLAEYVVKDVA